MTEWIPSEIIDELPVKVAAKNFDIAISTSAASEMYKNDLDFIGKISVQQIFNEHVSCSATILFQTPT